MINVDVFMLDWNQRRPDSFGSSEEFIAEAVAAFDAGRYEYSFSYSYEQERPVWTETAREEQDVAAAEAAYMAQGNNGAGRKVRRDRQTMSVGDAVLVDGKAYVAASLGFERAPALDERLPTRIEQSWERWTEDRPQEHEPRVSDHSTANCMCAFPMRCPQH